MKFGTYLRNILADYDRNKQKYVLVYGGRTWDVLDYSEEYILMSDPKDGNNIELINLNATMYVQIKLIF